MTSHLRLTIKSSPCFNSLQEPSYTGCFICCARQTPESGEAFTTFLWKFFLMKKNFLQGQQARSLKSEGAVTGFFLELYLVCVCVCVCFKQQQQRERETHSLTVAYFLLKQLLYHTPTVFQPTLKSRQYQFRFVVEKMEVQREICHACHFKTVH